MGSSSTAPGNITSVLSFSESSATGASVAISAVTFPRKMTCPELQPRPHSPPGKLQVQPANASRHNPNSTIATIITRASITTSNAFDTLAYALWEAIQNSISEAAWLTPG